MRLGARILLVLALLAALAPAAAMARTAAGGDGPRLSLRAPAEATAGQEVTVRGTAVAAPDESRAQVQVAAGGRWRALGGVELRRGRFRFSFELPSGLSPVRVRAQLLDGSRRLATSPVRAVRVRGAVPAPSASPSGGEPSPAASSPATSGTAPPAEPPPAPPAEPPTEPPSGQPYEGPMYWGAWIDGAPWDWNRVTEFESRAGKPLSLLQFSAPFADCSTQPCQYVPFYPGTLEIIRSHGAIPVFSWGSQSVPGKASDPDFQLSDLIDGSHDEYLEAFAAAVAAWGHPFFLRFDWEMNGNWFSWGEGANGNLPGEFVTAWRHVHDIFAAAGASNASWVWCPFVNPNKSPNIATELAPLYPGNEYVDWTCLDGYNWGYHPAQHQNWRTFNQLFASTYDEVERIAPGKPMLIGETASSEEGGSKAQWIEEMFAALPSRYPAVRGLLWFDVPDGGHDWPLATSTSAAAAFAAGVAGSRWLGNAFGALATSPIPAPG
jgi:hypothetical protein